MIVATGQDLQRDFAGMTMDLAFHKQFLITWTGSAQNNYIVLHVFSQTVLEKCLRAGRSGDRILVKTRFSASVQTCPGAHPASCRMYTGSFPGVKRPGPVVDHSPLSSADVIERVELYLYSPSGPSCPVLGLTVPLPIFTYNYSPSVITNLLYLKGLFGARGGLVVKALRHKPAGLRFDSRWCHWNFSVT
jgi:hypothetical protein